MTELIIIAGVLLVLTPWTGLWERNYFVREAPVRVRAVFESGIVRGAVTGFGLAHLVLASAEAAGFLREVARSLGSLRE